MKWVILTVIIAVISVHIYISEKWHNIVCKTFADYYSIREANPNCYFNPDVSSTIPNIIINNGYPIEIHDVTTDDGYILTLFRIKHGRNKSKTRNKPALLMHGIGLNAASFVTTGNKSLAFILADNGYDVWLGNFRGTKFSKHKSLNENDREYWNFSLREHGTYDISAIVNTVYDITKQKIVYVGFSLGTLSLYILGALNETVKDKVEVHVSIAPTVYVQEWKPPSSWLLHVWTLGGKQIIPLFTKGKMYASIVPFKFMRKLFCFPHPLQMITCQSFKMIIGGFNYDQIDPETLPISLMHNFDSTSCVILSHLHQQLLRGVPQNFDYGSEKNMQYYGSIEPPVFNLSKYIIPTHIIHSNNDFISTKLNVRTLYNNLPEPAKVYGTYMVDDDTFTHQDFLWAKDVVPLVYNHVVNFINAVTNYNKTQE